MKKINIPLPQIEGVELKGATVYLGKGVVVAEYGQEDIEEDAGKDISEIVVNENTARAYLDIDILDDTFDDKLNALTQLMTIAEAWNKFDEFKPDWENREQEKYFPFFGFTDGKFEFSNVSYVKLISDTHTSNFSFKTPERAEQFGKQFIDLFRIVLTN